MDRASLEQTLGQGLSLAEIGRRIEKDPSTVSYWLGKYGLQAVGRQKHLAKGGLSRDDLKSLVESGASLAAMAEAVGRSKGTVRHWLNRYGLRTRGRQGAPSRSGVEEARAGDLTNAIIVCPRHGPAEHVRELEAITGAGNVESKR